jgi:hypothetical protein
MAKLSPIGNNAQFINGVPAAGAKLFTYAAGSSTKQTTYTDEAGTIPQTNPIILDSRGEPAQPIWLTEGLSYKFVFTASTDSDPPASPIWDIDEVTGINDASLTIDQWIDSGVTPTYVNATQFTLPGDQTTAFQVNRRVKLLVTAGTVYGYISASVFGALTTITVVLDSGTLDTGLSSVQLGLITPNNTSLRATSAMIGDLAVTNAKLANSYINDLTTVTIDPINDLVAIADQSDSGNKKKALLPKGMVLLATYTASASAQIDVTEGFDGNYSQLYFVLENIIPATNAVELYTRISINGGSSFISTTTYFDALIVNSGTSPIGTFNNSATQWGITAATALSNLADEALCGEAYLYNPGVAKRPYFKSSSVYRNSSAQQAFVNRGGFNTNTTVNAIRFVMSAGNIASGKIYVYGVRK